jgi:tripartite-type tricarboxylate transporter receptor subunit TctC
MKFAKLGRWLLAFTLAAAGAAAAQDYPVKPVRVIVPWAPGGGADITARLVTAKLTESLGQQFVVENKAGATGTIGTDIVAKAAPDGYTLVLGTNSTFVIAVALGAKLPYDPDKDLTPIVRVNAVPHVLSVHPSLPVKTVNELIALIKAKPGGYSYGSSGNGSTPQLAGETFKLMTGLNLLHVPYKGSGQSLQDTIGGVVQVSFDTMPSQLGHLKNGRLRPLALLGTTRVPALPDTPTIAEAGFAGAEGMTWFGLYGPGGMPAALVQKLHGEVGKVMKLADVKARFDSLGAQDGSAESPQDFAASAKAEIAKYAKVAKAAGIKGE